MFFNCIAQNLFKLQCFLKQFLEMLKKSNIISHGFGKIPGITAMKKKRAATKDIGRIASDDLVNYIWPYNCGSLKQLGSRSHDTEKRNAEGLLVPVAT